MLDLALPSPLFDLIEDFKQGMVGALLVSEVFEEGNLWIRGLIAFCLGRQILRCVCGDV